MTWQLIEYNSFPGKFNMDFDLELVKNCKPDSPILRFYGWSPNCITIGANQSYSEINAELAQKTNIDIVKRPTGGRAILHAEELTYSVIMPNCKQFSGKELYKDISNAIILGLKSYNSKLSEVMLETLNPNFSELLKDPSGALCFASTAKSEIKYKGKKLVGSAQRKLGTAILQHGSILIGQYHRNLVNYLNVNEKEKSKLKIEICDKTTEVSTILGKDTNIQDLQYSIIAAFEEVLNAQFLTAEVESISH